MTLVPRVVRYRMPVSWIRYDAKAIIAPLLEAKASVLALRQIPFQRRWVKELQEVDLKLEIAGTSEIEGADFIGD